MRQRNHKCEHCGRIYAAFGPTRTRRNFCSEECRYQTIRSEVNQKNRIRYQVDPEWRAKIAAATKRWQVYRRSAASFKREREYHKQWRQRKIVKAQIGRIIRRIR